MGIKELFYSAIILSAVVSTTESEAKTKEYLTVGTGGVTGVYYPTGGAICRTLNKDSRNNDLGLRCSVESTGGSIYNLNTIRSGELDVGVAQSDWQYHAYHGTSKFTDKGANKDLRSIFSLHAEPFTVVARADSNINHISELVGKRVNIGNPGSGNRGTMEVVMDAFGWSKSTFKLAAELKASEQSKALCDGNLDAIVYTVGHPNAAIKEATTLCDAVLVEVSGKEISKLIDGNSYYRSAKIPEGMYTGNDKAVVTFGVGATFVSSSNVKSDNIYHLVKSVFENFDSFRKLHPALNHLTKKAMVRDGLSAPLHEGAKSYYKEAGLLN